jgi:hypothetical protein
MDTGRSFSGSDGYTTSRILKQVREFIGRYGPAEQVALYLVTSLNSIKRMMV